MALARGPAPRRTRCREWGDIQFGKDEQDPNRFIVVEHNYVKQSTPRRRAKKSRRVDMSRELSES